MKNDFHWNNTNRACIFHAFTFTQTEIGHNSFYFWKVFVWINWGRKGTKHTNISEGQIRNSKSWCNSYMLSLHSIYYLIACKTAAAACSVCLPTTFHQISLLFIFSNIVRLFQSSGQFLYYLYIQFHVLFFKVLFYQ